MQKNNVTLKAGTALKIRIVDENGVYVSQVKIIAPLGIRIRGERDILTFVFGEVNKVIDCSTL